jgi:putative ATP-dependent endonuclease of OLD family
VRISKVKIKNFRNFTNLEIANFPQSAVIVGENGIGKSNLIHALRLVLDPDLPDSARRLRAEDFTEHGSVSIQAGSEVLVEIEISEFENNADAQVAFSESIVKLSPLTARVTYLYRPRANTVTAEDGYTRDQYEVIVYGGTSETSDARRLRQDVAIHVLPALRDAVQELSRWRGSPVQELLEIASPSNEALTEAAKSISEAMNKLAQDENIESTSTNLRSRVASLGGERLGLRPTFGFTPRAPEGLIRSIRLFVDENRIRGVGETSTGNANVIYLALLLDRLNARRGNETVVDTVLSVEEPEAHLHPVLQRQLFKYLLSTETALVVTTHSPNIAAVTGLESIVLLRKGPDGGTVASKVEPGSFSDSVRADLERYLDVSRAEVLFSTAVFLVEGIAEQYLLPALASAFGFDFDEHGVVVTSVDGTDFGPYKKMLREQSYGVPHVVITDGDPTDRNGKYVYLGLKRSAELLVDDVEQQPLRTRVSRHRELGEDAYLGEDRLLLASPENSIYVGLTTLETDIAPLLRQQMISALDDLERSPRLRASFRTALKAPEVRENRKEILRRINHVSKGRYAQRLAGHVSELSFEDLAATIKADVEELGPAVGKELDALLTEVSYGYLLLAVDRVSWIVRGHGILGDMFEEDDDSDDWSSFGGDDDDEQDEDGYREDFSEYYDITDED